MPQIVPTKGNLMAVRRSLALASLGFEMMDRKRNILIREMMGLIDRADEIQSQIDSVFREAYASLQQANITLGFIQETAQAIPEETGITLRYRSVMGVEIPIVTMPEKPPELIYGMSNTNSMFDSAFIRFNRVKHLTLVLAEVESSIYRLAYAIKKTQKRANALKNIIIPNYETSVKFITEALEEKEREDFVRLKVLKVQGR